MVRSLFLPEDGEMWASNDFSSQEPRLLVHYASLLDLPGADKMVGAYQNDPNTDFHQMVADMAGIKRKAAKTIGLGLMYGMGILPLQFLPGESAATHALDGSERFTIEGLTAISPRGRVTLQVTSSGADDTLTDNTRSIELVVRLDGPMELATYREGGIMPAVLRRMAKQ
jgi:hypothetical protein